MTNTPPGRLSRLAWPVAFVVAVILWLDALDVGDRLMRNLVPCGEDDLQEQVSPDGQQRAVVYSAGCGAAGSQSYGVSVLWATQELEYAAPFNALATQVDEPISVAWRGSDTLDVTVPRRVLTSRGTPLVVARGHGVDVVYHDGPSRSPYARAQVAE